MATGQWPTIVDVATRTDPEGNIPEISEMLSQCNDYSDDAPYMEANEKTGHEFVPGLLVRLHVRGVIRVVVALREHLGDFRNVPLRVRARCHINNGRPLTGRHDKALL